MKIILINTSNRIFGFGRAGLGEGAIAGFKIIYVLNCKDAISVCGGGGSGGYSYYDYRIIWPKFKSQKSINLKCKLNILVTLIFSLLNCVFKSVWLFFRFDFFVENVSKGESRKHLRSKPILKVWGIRANEKFCLLPNLFLPFPVT